MNTLAANAGSTAASAAAPRGFARVALRGFTFMAGAIMLSKVASMVSYIVLAWFLTEADFGLFAVVVMATSLVGVLRDGGAQRILVQRREEFDRLCQPVLQLTRMYNVLAAVMLAASGPIWAAVTGEPDLIVLIGVAAVSLLFSSRPLIHRARLHAQMRFGAEAATGIAASLARHLLMVVLAMAGAGAMSFVIPMVAAVLFEWGAMRYVGGPLPKGPSLNRSLFRELFEASRWIMFGGAIGALAAQGDYLVLTVGAMHLLPAYFLGYRLTVSTSVMFAAAVQNVMLPTLTHLRSDPDRFSQAYRKATRQVMFAVTPVYLTASLAAPAVLMLALPQNWVPAVLVAQVMFIGMIGRSVLPLAISVVESQGWWRLRAAFIGADAVGVLVAAGIGVWIGSLAAVAVAVAAHLFFTTVVRAVIAGRLIGVPVGHTLRDILAPVLVGGACVILWAYFVGPAVAGVHLLVQAVIHGGGFPLLVAAAFRIAMPGRFRTALDMVRLRRQRRTASVPPGEGEFAEAAGLPDADKG